MVNSHDSRKIHILLEVMADLLSSIPINNIEEARLILKEVQETHAEERNSVVHGGHPHPQKQKMISKATPKERLIGSLPTLFQDQELFVKNEDLASFAQHILDIQIQNYKKKSRYEIIGIIICQISNQEDSSLQHVVDAIENLTKNESIKTVIKSEKKKDIQEFSWSDAIKTIGGLNQ